MVSAVLELDSEPSGTKTFGRYRWQAKQAVLRWLTCLSDDEPPIAIGCEQVEDLVLLYPDHAIFAQLKTKDRGSWSDTKICQKGGGLDSLIRTYYEIKKIPVLANSRFELWLEGAAAETKKTGSFFTDPSSADAACRKALVQVGIKRADLADFLSRLTIRSQQPSRAHVDAVVLLHIGTIWPSMGHGERVTLYEKLLARAEKAQSSEPSTVGATAITLAGKTASLNGSSSATAKAAQRRLLTQEELTTITPPPGGASRARILRQIASGNVASALELKMRAAGASDRSVATAQRLRAGSEKARLEMLASDAGGTEKLALLEIRLLDYAEVQVDRAKIAAAGNVIVAQSPADFVLTELRSERRSVADLDDQNLFARGSDDLIGYLCQLSDECKFWWRGE